MIAVSTPKFTKIAQLLLQAGANVNATDRSQRTALMNINDSVDMLRVLLQAGADPNVRDRNGSTMLHSANYSSVEFIKTLLEFKAQVKVRNNQGETPLHRAIDHAKLSTVELLLQAGADVNAATLSGQTP